MVSNAQMCLQQRLHQAGLCGSVVKTRREHFSNEDSPNSPISLYLISFADEAQFEQKLEAESVTQEDKEAELVEIADEDKINDGANDSIEVLRK